MSRILTTIDNLWYESIYKVKNYSEKTIEAQILKYGKDIFPDYYYAKSSFDFKKRGTTITKKPDIILISKSFTEWHILEVEKVDKGPSHMFTQLDVFTDCQYDLDGLAKHLIRKCPELIRKNAELRIVLAKTPKVLVIFDKFDEEKNKTVLDKFDVAITSVELYKTNRHNGSLLQLYGAYPYQIAKSVHLIPINNDPFHFIVKNAYFLKNPSIKEIYAMHQKGGGKSGLVKIIILDRDKKDDKVYVKIPGNPFDAAEPLELSKTLSNKYIIDVI